MGEILGYIKGYIQQGSRGVNLRAHIGILFFIASVIFFNYQIFNIEDDFIDTYFGSPLCVVFYFFFYLLAYYISLVILWFSEKSVDRKVRFVCFNRSIFWIKSLLFIGIISLDAGGYFHGWIYAEDMPFDLQQRYFVWYAFSNLKSFFIVFLPLMGIKFLFDRNDCKPLYGMTVRGFSPFPYFLMLLIMAPIIYIASLQPEFQDYYPIFKFDRLGFTLSKFWEFVILELCYALDFVGTEWIFRGALIIGMASLLGRNCVLPMVAVYAFLHFGKPLGETIGSVFGGYILGVIALRSGSIFGGVLIHIGVAFMMDLFALLQNKIF